MAEATVIKDVTTGKPKVGGAVFNAPYGTSLPATPGEDLNAAFVNLGDISEDGIDNDGSLTVQDIKAWGGQIVHTSTTEKKDTFKIKFIEGMNVNVLKRAYGASNVTVASSGGLITIHVNAKELPIESYVIDMILAGGKAKRIVIPRGKVTGIDNVVYKDNEPIAYGLTITSYPDSAGDNHTEYIQ